MVLSDGRGMVDDRGGAVVEAQTRLCEDKLDFGLCNWMSNKAIL